MEAGGINAFLIGSELRGLTRVRSASGVYPAVGHLATLAADVKAMLGPTTIVTYGADWTEYGAHVVDSGASEVRFPLDALWASSGIDVVGIDYYAPLADWRDGSAHLDRQIADSIYDRDYLAGNLRGGDAYDWFYANDAARVAQTRTPITDGLGKPWVFRAKDLWNWWSNAHVERVSGAELGSPTAWVPQSKPIWLTEIGCAAVDKGANQPSLFPDPKSAESGLPYFSTGKRDDLIQRRMLEAVLETFDPAHGATFEDNPVSTVYGNYMLDPTAIHLWTWDARPYPLFPAAIDVWSDGPNWETGHWLTGRFGGAPLDALIAAILSDAGIGGFDSSALGEGPDGYVIDRPMSPRAAIEPLALAYAFEASEEGATLRFRPRGGEPVAELDRERSCAARRCRRLAAHARAGNRIAARSLDCVYGRRDRLPPRGRQLAPPRRRCGARRACGLERRHERCCRGAPCRNLAAGSVGRPRDRRLRAAAERARADAWRCDHARCRRAKPYARAARDGRYRAAARARPRDRCRCVRTACADAAPTAAGIADAARAGPRGAARTACAAGRRSTGAGASRRYADPWPGAVAIWRSLDDGASYQQFAIVTAPRSSARRSTISCVARRAAGTRSRVRACSFTVARSLRPLTCAC